MYTKGPWVKGDMTIESAEGEDIALVAYKRHEEEFKANMSLIAAAPDLLVAVKSFLYQFESEIGKKWRNELVQLIEKAKDL